MALMTLPCKAHPELLALVRAAQPDYRKHKLYVSVTADVRLSQTYWDGGTRFDYTAVNLADKRSQGAPRYNPPQFGGPAQDPRVALPQGACIVKHGIDCGKPATAVVYMHPQDVAKLLPAPTQGA
jgi:hypothetical protein